MSVFLSTIKGYSMLSPFCALNIDHKGVQHVVTLLLDTAEGRKGDTPVFPLSHHKGGHILRINLHKGGQSCCPPFAHYYRDRDTYISLFRSSQSYVVPERLLQLRESCSFSEHAASTFPWLSRTYKNLPSARLPRGGATGLQRAAAGSFPTLSQALPSLGVGSHG
jgi:hypothetical protein